MTADKPKSPIGVQIKFSIVINSFKGAGNKGFSQIVNIEAFRYKTTPEISAFGRTPAVQVGKTELQISKEKRFKLSNRPDIRKVTRPADLSHSESANRVFLTALGLDETGLPLANNQNTEKHLEILDKYLRERFVPDKLRAVLLAKIDNIVDRALLIENKLDNAPSEPLEGRDQWIDRTSKENPLEFIDRVYHDREAQGLIQADLKRLDPALYRAMFNWLNGPKGGPKRALPPDFGLPTKKERNDQLLAEIDDDPLRPAKLKLYGIAAWRASKADKG